MNQTRFLGGMVPSQDVRGEIHFKDIVFSYPSRPQHVILDSLNLTLACGSVTAVVGASGSGKSTLALLLLRLYDPQRGAVLLDGQSVDQYDPVWLRKNIGTVSQVRKTCYIISKSTMYLIEMRSNFSDIGTSFIFWHYPRKYNLWIR